MATPDKKPAATMQPSISRYVRPAITARLNDPVPSHTRIGAMSSRQTTVNAVSKKDFM